MDGDIISQALLISISIKLLLAFLSMPMAWLMLRLFDRTLKVNFKQRLQEMSDDAFARYAGLRFMGVCVLLGAALL